MKQKLIALITAILLLLTCGCSLAQPTPENELHSGDRLVGVMVTTEYLDLFDMEAWLNDNINKLNPGGTTQISGDTTKYEGRIYAEQVKEQSTRSDGTTGTYYTWEFPETLDAIMGALFICPTMTDPETGEQYTHSVVDGCLSEPKTHVKSTDFGDSIELSCTVYFDPYRIQKEIITDEATGLDMEHIAFYTNPVYQTPEGDVYVTSGMGNSYSIEKELGMDHFNSSSTLTDSVSQTIDGKTTETQNKVTVNFQGVRMAREITLLEMNHNHKLLRSKSYMPAEFPSEIKVSADTAYIIVETLSVDNDGVETISRQICTADHPDESFTVFVPAEKGFTAKQTTKVITE